MESACLVMVAVRGGSGCELSIVISHKPSYVFLVPLNTVFLSELKIVTSLFVKSDNQLESRSCPIEMSLAFFRFVYTWACVDFDGNIGRGGCPESVG